MIRRKLTCAGLLMIFCFVCVGTLRAQTSSPFRPPDEKLGRYVVNSGPGLDTGCTFRSGGPLIINIKIPATMNPKELNPDGTLKEPDKLTRSGVIGYEAKIDFPVYDIDSGATTNGYAPEVDYVSFNGKRLPRTLSGINDTWTNDSVTVPISEIKFNADNELRIDIDQGNLGGYEYWCMAVDWVSVEFEAAAPYVLMHGIDADASTWDDGKSPRVIQALDEAGVLWTRFSTGKNELSNTNARDLEKQINAFLQPLKGDKVHIIAHSKGGLDAQALAASAPPFKILSLVTLSTPHYGSVAADLSIIQKENAKDKVNSGEDPNGFASNYIGMWTFGQGPQLPGLRDLTTYAASSAIISGLRGTIKPTYSFGANADINGNNKIDMAEAASLFKYDSYHAERVWRVLRDFTSAPIVSTSTKPGLLWGTKTVLTYQTNPGGPYDNDIVVTTNSANPSYATSIGDVFANHATMKNGDLIIIILPLTLPLK